MAAAEAPPTKSKKKHKSKKKKQPSSTTSAGPSSTAYSGKRGSPEGPAPAPLDNHDVWSSGEELEFHDAHSELPGESHNCHVIITCIYMCVCQYYRFYCHKDRHVK